MVHVNAISGMARRKKSQNSKSQLRSWDRFCEDTSVLGVRYLHSRYKFWFRVLWVILLVSFLMLTAFQIYQRISTYMENPLTVDMKRQNMENAAFPSVIVCNQMQLRLSGIGSLDMELLKTMSTIIGQEESSQADNVTSNVTIAYDGLRLEDFDHVDMLQLLRRSQQPQTDFVIGCLWRMAYPCEIHPVQGPMGQCYEIMPTRETIIKRPGPEFTLTILLNIEIRESMPGFGKTGAQVFLVPHEGNETHTPYYRGLHLSEGQDLALSISETRVMSRYESECGTLVLESFGGRNYTQASCQWESISKEVEEECGCVPIYSSRVQDYNNGTQFTEQTGRRMCTLSEMFGCANRSLRFTLESEGKHCPADCEEKEFASIMVGSRLQQGDVLAFQPSNWQDMKDERLEEFHNAFAVVPIENVKLVKNIKHLASTVQDFLDHAGAIFNASEESKGVPPCIFDNQGNDLLAGYLEELAAGEEFWEIVPKIWHEDIYPYLVNSIYLYDLSEFGTVPKPDVPDIPFNIDRQIFGEISRLRAKLNSNNPDDAFPWVFDNNTIHKALFTKLNNSVDVELLKCSQLVTTHSENVTNKNVCAEKFRASFGGFAALASVAGVGSSSDGSEFETSFYQGYVESAESLASELYQVTYSKRLLIIQPGRVELDKFADMYMERGAEYKRVQGILESRGNQQMNMGESITEIVKKLRNLRTNRQKAMEDLGMSDLLGSQSDSSGGKSSVFEGLEKIQQCLTETKAFLDKLQKHAFLKAEWVSRLKQAAREASAYGSGPEYDEVNLLLLKVYYSQLREEVVTQMKSYDVWVLLAEIGGTIGLYLGATLVTMFEIAVFCTEGGALRDDFDPVVMETSNPKDDRKGSVWPENIAENKSKRDSTIPDEKYYTANDDPNQIPNPQRLKPL